MFFFTLIIYKIDFKNLRVRFVQNKLEISSKESLFVRTFI